MRCTCAHAHVHTHCLYLRNRWADNVQIRYVAGDGSTDRFPQVNRGTIAPQCTCKAHSLVYRQQGFLLVLTCSVHSHPLILRQTWHVTGDKEQKDSAIVPNLFHHHLSHVTTYINPPTIWNQAPVIAWIALSTAAYSIKCPTFLYVMLCPTCLFTC